MASNHYDLILCGGGVIGLSIALQCARKGWRICVVDQGAIGMQSSWAGAGILPSAATNFPLDPIEQLRALSHPLHGIWAKKLLELTGIDNEYRPCGGLYLGRSPAERATLIANTFWWDEHAMPYEQWTKNQAMEQVPDLFHSSDADQKTDFWWMPNDCRVRNPDHVRALLSAIKQLGVDVIEHKKVIEIIPESPTRFCVKLQSGSQLHASRVCVTAGAWTQLLLEKLGISTGVLPVRGQMLLYKSPNPLFRCVVNDGHRYLMPRDDGHILAGSCEEEVGFDTSTTAIALQDIQHWAESVVPSLANIPIVKSWSGLRPGSFDGYPYLGEAPGYDGLYVASGHFRHGLHWSTGTALLMQQLMFHEPTAIDLKPFRILRGNNSRT